MRRTLGTFLLALAAASPAMAAKRAMTVDDLLAVKGVSDPQVSPDGKHVVYVVSELDKATQKSNSDLWIVPTAGGEPRRLTTSPGPDNHPRWSTDGRSIVFTSARGGSMQAWQLPIDGGEARQVTKLPIDIDGPIVSPKGDKIAFAARVYPGKSPAETAEIDERKAKEKSQVKIYDRLMIRHWTEWDDGKRSHLFVADLATGEARDLTPKFDRNTPPAPFGGSSDYAFSPLGNELAFTAEPAVDPALSTNTDIWIVSTSGNTPVNLSEDNPGADAQPAYSPDGEYLAYLSQARAGFEADRWALMVRDRDDGSTSDVTAPLDRSVASFAWGATHQVTKPFEGVSRDLVAVFDDAGSLVVRRIGVLSDEDGHLLSAIRPEAIGGGTNTSAQAVPGSDAIVFAHAASDAPAEIARANPDGSAMEPLTKHNAPLVADLDVHHVERFDFKGADDDAVSGWVLKPPGFDPSKKYPVAFLIHGGPQGAWHDEWHGRWNYQMFAAPGYAVVAINPRGSTGYGQRFTDQISQDWTGRVYTDLMAGLDHALKTYPYLDGSNVAAAGGSYGGFMANWIAGHSDRFKALVSHAGVFDLPSMYGTTEELWFAEWEFGGTPWEQPKRYHDQSPSNFAEGFKTPTLVIHGALDFRVPEAQGFGMFTTLQRRGVPSRLVYFPDEGHWILKPANRIVWWREVHAWMAQYLKK
ncbi:S9 family peptidase [Tundrisphaera sp. TA3]|uniref:S9 family peptidase n=1 Tax=Tundrisphaera sp. TA3 TaxID=3435775 RepID=UPI003EBE4964